MLTAPSSFFKTTALFFTNPLPLTKAPKTDLENVRTAVDKDIGYDHCDLGLLPPSSREASPGKSRQAQVNPAVIA
jgi:hypothetical protein